MCSSDLESRHLASEDSHGRLIRVRNESKNPSASCHVSSVCHALSDIYWSNYQRIVKDVRSDDESPQREKNTKFWIRMRHGSELEHWGRRLSMLASSYMLSFFVYMKYGGQQSRVPHDNCFNVTYWPVPLISYAQWCFCRWDWVVPVRWSRGGDSISRLLQL